MQGKLSTISSVRLEKSSSNYFCLYRKTTLLVTSALVQFSKQLLKSELLTTLMQACLGLLSCYIYACSGVDFDVDFECKVYGRKFFIMCSTANTFALACSSSQSS